VLGNENFDRKEILRAHREATIRRMSGHGGTILAVQDTTGVNHNTRLKTGGMMYSILDKWKLLYRMGNKTKKGPKKPYTIKEVVDCLGRPGGPKRAPSDGPPGVKTIWIGLMKLYSAGVPGVPHVILWVKCSASGGVLNLKRLNLEHSPGHIPDLPIQVALR
jgi:hypothetical protein